MKQVKCCGSCRFCFDEDFMEFYCLVKGINVEENEICEEDYFECWKDEDYSGDETKIERLYPFNKPVEEFDDVERQIYETHMAFRERKLRAMGREDLI